eukprot:1765474-Amphidinium_carterae.1
MRQEHFERLRRRGEAAVAMTATDEMPPFYPEHSWDWVFAAAGLLLQLQAGECPSAVSIGCPARLRLTLV